MLASHLHRKWLDVPAASKVFAWHLLRTKMTTVGSQDTTGPMTRDELQDLACLGFSADLTMQSFCHTAAYPKPVDIETKTHCPTLFAIAEAYRYVLATASFTAGSTACFCLIQ